ncbi:hypothetical protein B7H17_02435 [Pseudomonas putida]|uniref:Uncharacterized protein n=1 Tax=Pseudomonas putida TaxID=303 RepID=A0A1X1A846_PSEPU|nr:hypothetical protein B7H17_02435 [Pseudomonas putida]
MDKLPPIRGESFVDNMSIGGPEASAARISDIWLFLDQQLDWLAGNRAGGHAASLPTNLST